MWNELTITFSFQPHLIQKPRVFQWWKRPKIPKWLIWRNFWMTFEPFYLCRTLDCAKLWFAPWQWYKPKIPNKNLKYFSTGTSNGRLRRQTSMNCYIGSPGGQYVKSQWCPWWWQSFQHLAVELPFRGNELWGIWGAKEVQLETGHWGWHQSLPKWAETGNCGWRTFTIVSRSIKVAN